MKWFRKYFYISILFVKSNVCLPWFDLIWVINPQYIVLGLYEITIKHIIIYTYLNYNTCFI